MNATRRTAPEFTARRALELAAAAGLVHAFASLYWAAGGRWQLESVGQWAVHLADEYPVVTGLALAALAGFKAVAAAAPLVNERRRNNRFYTPIRLISWVGACLLVVWGGVSAVSAWTVLSGLITPAGGYHRETMLGHGLVWDPLFVIWGVALIVGLARTHRPGASKRSPRPRTLGRHQEGVHFHPWITARRSSPRTDNSST